VKSTKEMSKYRQSLYLQAIKWETKSSALSKKLFSTPQEAAESAFCKAEAEKCRDILKRLRGTTYRQQRAGWGGH